MNTKTLTQRFVVHIDPERCKGCALCIHACPHGCIIMGDAVNSYGYVPAVFAHAGRCTGCGCCVRMCPEPYTVAIKKTKEKSHG